MVEKEGTRGVSALKIIIYIAVSFLLAVFQTTVAHRVALFGATPQLTLSLTCAAAYFYGPVCGGAVGLISGVFTEALGSTGISVLPLLYFLVGWFCGMLTRRSHAQRSLGFFGFITALAAVCGAGSVITVICLMLSAGKANILTGFLHIALPEIPNTFLYGLPIGAVHFMIDRIRSKKTEDHI